MIAAVVAPSVFPCPLGFVPLIHVGSFVTSSFDVSQTSLPIWSRLDVVKGFEGPGTSLKFTRGVVLSRNVCISVGK